MGDTGAIYLVRHCPEIEVCGFLFVCASVTLYVEALPQLYEDHKLDTECNQKIFDEYEESEYRGVYSGLSRIIALRLTQRSLFQIFARFTFEQ